MRSSSGSEMTPGCVAAGVDGPDALPEVRSEDGTATTTVTVDWDPERVAELDTPLDLGHIYAFPAGDATEVPCLHDAMTEGCDADEQRSRKVRQDRVHALDENARVIGRRLRARAVRTWPSVSACSCS